MHTYITWFDIKRICYIQIRISFLGGVHLSPRYLWILNVSTRWAARLLVHVTTQWFLLLGLTEKPLNSAAEFEIRHFHEFFPPTFKVLSNKVLRLFLFMEQNLRLRLVWASLAVKGQIISKRFFSGQGFFQKRNENMSHTSKNEFIHSFFGRIHGLIICFRNEPTFRSMPLK